MMRVQLAILALTIGILPMHVFAAPKVKTCAAESCFAAGSLPPVLTPIASAFCESFVHKRPGTVTSTVTAIATTTTTPARKTVTISSTDTLLDNILTTCSTLVTATASFPTSTGFPARSSGIMRRSAPTLIPSEISAGCEGDIPALVSSACSCFLKPTTIKTTTTLTSTHTASLAPTTTTTIFVKTITSIICTSTATSTTTAFAGATTCGIANPSTPTSGDIACISPVPMGETNGRLRIEGGDEGTIFEGCIFSRPANVTTPSGGTHECDGLNDNANPSPGATCITQLNAASVAFGFPFDGTFDDEFDDFFITSIDTSTQTNTEFWGLLQDLVFTSAGGCQTEIAPGGKQETLWAYNAFNVAGFLHIEPGYQVVYAGSAESVQFTVTSADGSGDAAAPFAGAEIEGAGVTTDSSGVASIAVPTLPGCYLYKASADGQLRSNAFYLTVLPAPS